MFTPALGSRCRVSKGGMWSGKESDQGIRRVEGRGWKGVTREKDGGMLKGVTGVRGGEGHWEASTHQKDSVNDLLLYCGPS